MRCWSSQLTPTSCFWGGFEVVVGSIVVIRSSIIVVLFLRKNEGEEEEKKDGFKTLTFEFFYISTKP